MSQLPTASIAPSTSLTLPAASLSASESWLKVHERLIIVVLALGLIGWGTDKVFDLEANRDKQAASIAQQTLAAQQAKDAQLSQVVAASTAQYQTLVTSLTQQNSQLISSVQARNSTLAVQQTADKVLTPSSLAERWETLTKSPTGSIVDNGQTVTVTPDAALETVTELEEVPVLTANFNDGKLVLQNTKDELTSANTVIANQKTEIAGLNTQLTDQKTADAKELAAEKAAARKSKIKTFFYGFAAGFVSGILIK